MNNLETKLLQDFTLPYNQRLSLVGFLQSLPQGVQNQINTATSTLVGAGIGAAIAKLLLNMGIGGTLIFQYWGVWLVGILVCPITMHHLHLILYKILDLEILLVDYYKIYERKYFYKTWHYHGIICYRRYTRRIVR